MFKSALFWKVFILLGLTLLMLIPIGMVLDLIDGRNEYQQSVISRVEDGTSGEQTIIGPMIVVPFVKTIIETDRDGKTKTQNQDGKSYILPERLSVNGNVNVEPRKVGIYRAQVYQSDFQFSGTFPQVTYSDSPSVTYGKPYLVLALVDSRGITQIPEIKLNDHEPLMFEAGTYYENFPQGMHVNLPKAVTVGNKPLSFEFKLSLQGTGGLAVVPIGASSEFHLSGNWPHPNFLGQFLPKKRVVTDEGFTASWESSWIANNINNNFGHYSLSDLRKRTYATETYGKYGYDRSSDVPTFSTSFIEPVNHYQLNTRTVKYAILFISLTFVAFFLFEMLKSLSIHPMQYLLVGAALMVFYVILLAFSERIGFAWAYCIAALSCSSLIGFYLSAVLNGIKRGIGFSVALLALYGILYVLLQSEDNALLLGAILLFTVLTVVMTLTRRLDWYKVAAPSAPSIQQSSSSGGPGLKSSEMSGESTTIDNASEIIQDSSKQSLERRKYRLWK